MDTNRRREWISAGAVLLVMLSVFAALVVVATMAGAGAATGGCGGG